ncbi:MAG: tetratricopeptide repeat protein, partial [bacterium]
MAIREKVLGPEHPYTANSLNNLAALHLAQTKAAAAEPLLQRLNRAQANWLRRELPLQPRDLRGGLIDQQPDAPANTFALLDQRPAAAPLALETRLNRQGLLAEIERRQT